MRNRAGVGASSIILIVVVLCLAVLGALMLMSARADQKLTDKTQASVEAYYAADRAAQGRIAQIHELLRAKEAVALEGVTVSGAEISFSIPIDENRALSVALETGNADARCRITRYQVVGTGEWNNQDNNLNLY